MVVQAFLTMLPRLGAGERLDAISDRAVASGGLPQFDAMRAIRALEEMRSDRRQRPARPTPAVLAGMGIGMVRAPSAPSETAVNDG